jgi:hypothetical protein
MGEWSRRVGEVGEEIVGEFLELIGWGSSQRNLTLPCIRNQRHMRQDRPRQTHGIDCLFSYESPLCARTLDHLVISVKYTSDPYPTSPNSKFKEHFADLAQTMECFKNSEIRQSTSRHFSGIDSAREIGVLFWLTNTSDIDDIISRVSGVRDIDNFSYKSIYVVDNKRISFIYDTIKYLSANRPNSEIEFFYPYTGRNNNPLIRELSGKVLPVEFVNSSVIPLKLNNRDKSNKTFVVSVLDNFHKDHLKRLMGLACEMTSDFATDTLILFPDFDRLLHENQVLEAKSSFRNSDFTASVSVLSYRMTFRNTP